MANRIHRLWPVIHSVLLAALVTLSLFAAFLALTFALWPLFPPTTSEGVWRAVVVAFLAWASAGISITASKSVKLATRRAIRWCRTVKGLITVSASCCIVVCISVWWSLVTTRTLSLDVLIDTNAEVAWLSTVEVDSVMARHGMVSETEESKLFSAYLASVQARERGTSVTIADEGALRGAAQPLQPIMHRVIAHLGLAQSAALTGDHVAMMQHLQQAESLALLVAWRDPKLSLFVYQEQLLMTMRSALTQRDKADRLPFIELFRQAARSMREAEPDAEVISAQIKVLEGAECFMEGDFLGAYHRWTELENELAQLAQDPDYSQAERLTFEKLRADILNNRGLVRMNLGQMSEAAQDFADSLILEVGDARRTRINLVYALGKSTDVDLVPDLVNELQSDPAVLEELAVYAISIHDSKQRAALLSRVLGRDVSHASLSESEAKELARRCIAVFPGLPIEAAEFLDQLGHR